MNPYNLTPEEKENIIAAMRCKLDGKPFQQSIDRGKTWVNSPATDTAIAGFNAYIYRPVPEPKTVPLTAEDVPDDAVFLSSGVRMVPVYIREDCVQFAQGKVSYDTMMEIGMRYRRAGETEWKPCSKEVV